MIGGPSRREALSGSQTLMRVKDRRGDPKCKYLKTRPMTAGFLPGKHRSLVLVVVAVVVMMIKCDAIFLELQYTKNCR